MDRPNKLFKHNNGTSTPARWFDLEAFNQWSEQIINKCDILHTRPHRARATTSDAHPCMSVPTAAGAVVNGDCIAAAIFRPMHILVCRHSCWGCFY